MDCNPPGSFVHGIFQGRIVEGVAMPSSRGSSQYIHCVRAKSLQSWLTLWDLIDSSPPGSSLHGILQTTILEWVAMSYFRGFSWLRDWTVSLLSQAVFTIWAIREPPRQLYSNKRKKRGTAQIVPKIQNRFCFFFVYKNGFETKKY